MHVLMTAADSHTHICNTQHSSECCMNRRHLIYQHMNTASDCCTDVLAVTSRIHAQNALAQLQCRNLLKLTVFSGTITAQSARALNTDWTVHQIHSILGQQAGAGKGCLQAAVHNFGTFQSTQVFKLCRSQDWATAQDTAQLYGVIRAITIRV